MYTWPRINRDNKSVLYNFQVLSMNGKATPCSYIHVALSRRLTALPKDGIIPSGQIRASEVCCTRSDKASGTFR